MLWGGAALALLLGSTGSRLAPDDAVEESPTLAALPADFIENRGQWSGSARFVARRGSLRAAFHQDSLRIHQGEETPLALRFEGASQPTLVGEGRRPGEYNFFFGNDPRRWRSRVPAWAGVLYRGLYPGVDLRVREEAGRLEYDVERCHGGRHLHAADRRFGILRGAAGVVSDRVGLAVLDQHAARAEDVVAGARQSGLGHSRPLVGSPPVRGEGLIAKA